MGEELCEPILICHYTCSTCYSDDEYSCLDCAFNREFHKWKYNNLKTCECPIETTIDIFEPECKESKAGKRMKKASSVITIISACATTGVSILSRPAPFKIFLETAQNLSMLRYVNAKFSFHF